MELRVGTSGFSYPGWKGSFYPDKLPRKDMLGYYAERFPAVEINNTFYRLPGAGVLEGWRASVPPSFRFVLKASRRITHFRRLQNTAEETGYLLQTADTLKDRLGGILFQLPPNLPRDVPRLADFLDTLPDSARATFEFRHPSWFDSEIYDALRSHGCALCLADTDDGDPPPLVNTAPWGYLRLRRAGYTEAELEGWVARIGAQGWKEAFVFFKHEDEGTGPRLAARFLDLASRAG